MAPARAWIYPEHRDIAVAAVEKLDPDQRARLDSLWQLAFATHRGRLCATAAETGQGIELKCLDWAALPAIAGDHSCSSAEMQATVMNSQWIMDVASIAAGLKVELDLLNASVSRVDAKSQVDAASLEGVRRSLENADLRARRYNALRDSDLRIQRADPAYATRASANSAHFLVPRTGVTVDQARYAAYIVDDSTEINALGVYTKLHASALAKIALLADPDLPPDERGAVALAALMDEAFGLHFLEDAFSAGHMAGIWGNASQRRGTHDYYNQNGIEAYLWDRREQPVLLMGDAYMRTEDEQVAAEAVYLSIAEFLDARSESGLRADPGLPQAADRTDVCHGKSMADSFGPRPTQALPAASVAKVLSRTPIPALSEGPGSVPRFRSEFGGFIGIASSVEGRVLNGGFAADQYEKGWMSGLDVSLRGGLGMAGVLGPSGDGLTFVSVGLHADTPSSSTFTQLNSGQGSLTAAIPGRTGYALRARMPFAAIPGDLILLSPLYFFNREAYERLAISAVNGGLLPWQSGMATAIGRFQFVLGRELGITFYGRRQAPDEMFVLGPPPQYSLALIKFRSTLYDFPVLEYRPYRSYSGDQSTTLTVQLFVDVDVPSHVQVIEPIGQAVRLHALWSAGLRLRMDWRHYP
jgi:hypothetical protein